MTWKNLVAFSEGSEEGLTLTRAALALAQKTSAHVETLVCYSPPRMPLGLELAAIDETYDRMMQEARAEADAAVAVLETIERPGVSHSVRVQSALEVGFEQIGARAAPGADLVVLHYPEANSANAALLHGALLQGGAPCLVMPRWSRPHDWGARVLVAWKARPEAARAIRAAVPLLQAAESVRVVLIDPQGADAGEDEAGLARLGARWLRHGIHVEAPVITRSNLGDAGRAIADEAEGFGASLIVMGAYGHSRLTEWIWGGATRHMLQHGATPLLLAH